MTAKIKLNAASGGGSVSVEAPTSTTGNANVELKLPIADGSNGQALTTNGSGQLAFSNVSGTTINNEGDNKVVTSTSSSGTLQAEDGLTFDGTNLDVASGNSNMRMTTSSNTPKIIFTANNVSDAGKIQCSESGGGASLQFSNKNTGGTLNENFRIHTNGQASF